MSNFTLSTTPSPAASKPARRPSHLGQLFLNLLAEHGQMPRSDLIQAALACLMEQGRPAHKANLYTRLRALKDAGWVEIRRMDGAAWVMPAVGNPAKAGKRHVIQGHATVRRGKAKFTAKAEGCPAYSGSATLTFIK